jgi:hypothetical protein
METSAAVDRPTVTSHELVEQAIRAHRLLFRLIGTDEPDLGANVVYSLGRSMLQRVASAEPWIVDADAGAAARAFIAAAEGITDAHRAEEVFYSFPQQVIARLVPVGPPLQADGAPPAPAGPHGRAAALVAAVTPA